MKLSSPNGGEGNTVFVHDYYKIELWSSGHCCQYSLSAASIKHVVWLADHGLISIGWSG